MRSNSAISTPASTLRNPVFETPPTPSVPTIRLTTATPSAADSPIPSRSRETSVLAPKPQSDSRKRLVPKKSKLSLLVGNKRSDKGKDLSDVARRVGVSPSSAGRSFDIYVDPADDPDIGEIVVLKKKKSRGGLNELRWAALEDVANAAEETEVAEVKTIMKKPDPLTTMPSAKSDEKDKWWTLGRRRRDSKDLKFKGKENSLGRAKTMARRPTRPSLDIHRSYEPEKTDNPERQRSQSFDATMLLNSNDQLPLRPRCITVPMPDDDDANGTPPRRTHTRTMTSPSIFVPHSTASNEDAGSQGGTASRNGSVALRAMRSVRSLARIGSWAQLKNMPVDDENLQVADAQPVKKHKRRTSSMRSIEVLKDGFASIRRKSTDMTGTVRSVSSQSTATSSAWSEGTGRPSRRASNSTATSSVHTNSSGDTTGESTIGREPKRNRASSIRWDDQTETVKEKHMQIGKSGSVKKEKESKKTLSGRRRPSLASLFSEIGLSKISGSQKARKASAPIPVMDISLPQADPDTSGTLLDENSVLSMDTPKRTRPRPLSEDMFGRNRPSAIIGDEDGVIQILDEATSDLASLINRLDLEATPHATPRGKTPKSSRTVRQQLIASDQSPTAKDKKSLSEEKSVDSLRSYARRLNKKSQNASNLLYHHPEPVPKLPALFAGRQEPQNTTVESDESETVPVFRLPQELRRNSTSSPATSRTLSRSSAQLVSRAASLPSSRELMSSDDEGWSSHPSFRASSSFVGHSSKTSMSTTIAGDTDNSHYKGSRADSLFSLDPSSPIKAVVAESMNKRLSRRSTVTAGRDSDIPAELQQLLSRNFNRDSMSSVSGGSKFGSGKLFIADTLPPVPGTPPKEPLPPVQSSDKGKAVEKAGCFLLPSVYDVEESAAADFEEDDDADHSDNDTKKSFDFTAELSQLTASGGDRRSFVVQLEDAFKTPTKSDLRNLAAHLGYGKGDKSIDVPPVPAFRRPDRSSFASSEASHDKSISPPVSFQDSRYSFTSDDVTTATNPTDEDICVKQPSAISSASKHYSGHLDKSFRFGRMLAPETNVVTSLGQRDASLSRSSSMDSYTSDKPLTLSDIIPPPSHESRRQSFISVSEEESSMLQSIISKADECSIFSGSNRSSFHEEENRSMNDARIEALAQLTTHSRRESEVSFSGLSTFSEIRRGFEFGASRTAFYPPTQPSRSLLPVPNSLWRTSLFSVASVSSYGQVLRPGLRDPFDYGNPVCPEPRPISEDMSYTVDDTFSFMRHGLDQRQRADSDASTYSFHAPPSAFGNTQTRRNRRQIDSMVSVASGPPVSLYNRGFGHHGHKWSVDQPMGFSGNNASAPQNGRLSMHHRNASFESLRSDFSAQRLERPGVGDKMFESAQNHDYGAPLSMISASPSQLESSRHHTTFDSIMDGDLESHVNDRSRSNFSGLDDERSNHSLQAPGLQAPIQLRPVSVYSFNSHNSPKRDDDTMISMLGGGYVRRRSIGSTFEGSPCARAEKRHHSNYAGRVLARIPSGDVFNNFGQEYMEDAPMAEECQDLPELDRVEAEPEELEVDQDINKSQESVVSSNRSSVSGHHFGEGRMDMARRGLLERQSLEDCCLSAEGEDTTTSRRSFGIFSKPEPAFRNRTGVPTQGSLYNNTPPLSVSETSSLSSMSQHSIDLAKLDAMLANAAPESSEIDKSRLRPHGQGHRYRRSHVRASWTSSVYETIHEEGPDIEESSEDQLEGSASQRSSLLLPDIKVIQWENEDVGPALRKILELQAETRKVVDASRSQWEDTPFSLFTLQSFRPPMNAAGMQALLEHSQRAFGPLPSELRGCHRRPRTASRPSPYPRNRAFFQQTDESRASLVSKASEVEAKVALKAVQAKTAPLKDHSKNGNIEKTAASLIPILKPFKSIASFSDKSKERKVLQALDKNELKVSREQSVDNNVQKIVLGAGKRKIAGKSPRKPKAKKENVTDSLPAKAAESLRIVRPRPKGRPALTTRALRI